MRIALATLRFRPNPEEALNCVKSSLENAAAQGATLLCTPENYLPGLRGVEFNVTSPDPTYLARIEHTLCATAAKTGVGAIIGVERITHAGIIASAMVIAPNGQLLGYQDKVQIDPSEDGTYIPGTGRQVFQIDDLRFGICICHEGWRYPETVRWASRRGAQIVFHPQYSPSAASPRTSDEWASADGTMHEKAAICRAAENTIYFGTVNYALPNSIAGTAMIDPEGNISKKHSSGDENVLVVDIAPLKATGLLAKRLSVSEYL